MGRLRRRPHGIILGRQHPVGVLARKVFHADKLVHLDVPELSVELARLESEDGDEREFPLRLIGLRELRSHNSWMHNVPKLMQGGREHAARIHPTTPLPTASRTASPAGSSLPRAGSS